MDLKLRFNLSILEDTIQPLYIYINNVSFLKVIFYFCIIGKIDMAANKINNKIEIKETFCKVIKTDLTMEVLSPGLPIFYQCPVYCYMNNVEVEYNKSSKPCIMIIIVPCV